MESEDVRLELRAGFDLAADLYDRTRPVCPAALFDDLIRLTELGPGDPVLEIGCGTGQATLPLAERGLRVTAVELGAELAGLARKKLAGFPTVTVATSSFEAWSPDASPYSAVVAVNSLHWLDPELRYAKPAQVLNPADTSPSEAACGPLQSTRTRFSIGYKRTTGQWVSQGHYRQRPRRLARPTSQLKLTCTSKKWLPGGIHLRSGSRSRISSITWPPSPASVS